ncbi:tethering complex subunit PEP5 [Rhodotorula paludigena]|uniref:tethering complex subunit PEP5 n=1 Tax=Rhodotorula paludigena TaxID=86838 RepID=UPI003171B221
MSARATPTTRTQPSPAPAPALAAPAWRQFSFFHAAPIPSPATTPTRSLTAQPALVSAVHSNVHLADTLVLVADLDGNLHAVDDHWEPLHTWPAYDGGRVTHILSSEWDLRAGRAIVVTVGDDASSPFPLLKVWLLSLPSPATAAPTSPDSPALPHLTLLRRAPISPVPARPSPVSALALAPSLSHVVLGLADGTVVAFKRLDDLVEASLVDLDDAAARAAPLEPGASRARSAAGNGAGARDAFVPGGMGKLRVLWDGNREPVTNLGITAAPPPPSPAAGTQTLFVLTTSQILALPLPPSSSSAKHASKAQQPTVLDDHGAAVGCARVMRLGGGKGLGGAGAGAGAGEGEQTAERMVVARDEAIYVYGPEGREGCWAYEGSKSSIVPLHSSTVTAPSSPAAQRLPTAYLAIVSPPQPSSLASTSATIRQHARATANANGSAADASNGAGAGVAKVTVFDPENKFVAYSGTFGQDEGGAVREVVEAWGAVWVLTEGGKLFRLTEQPIEQSFETLFQRNLFTLGISLAHSRGLGEREVADIYRRHGDHLYGKSDYEGAMAAYLKTVGTVQASYVIRKFLDAQRLTHLTSYLQELHSRGLANSDITTLLLNCYTKLKDDDALSRFIHSSSSSSPSTTATIPSTDGSAPAEPPFDLETAIRVLRQAGYFTHATWLAQRYRAHADFLRIAIEDAGDYVGALRYVRELARGGAGGGGAGGEGEDEARESMQRWGGVLLAHEPDLTTDVLVEICCGKEGASAREGKDRVASLRAASGARDASPNRRAASTNAYDMPDSASLSGSTAAGGEPLTAEPDAFSTLITTTAPDLPSPRQFFAHFVDRPRHFVSFLEQVAARRYGRPVDSLVPPATLIGADAPLPEPRDAVEEGGGARRPLDARARDEQVVWNTLLELYVSPLPPRAEDDKREREQLQAKALRVLRCRDQAPYDETQALLVCTTQGFEEGFVLLYELLGMYEEIVRYWIDAAKASPSAPDRTSRIVRALHRYGPSCPSLYRLVLSHLTSSSDLLSRHQADVLDILDEVDREKVLPAIAVVQILSAGGVASVGLVREYLKRQLLAEKQEIDSDQALITSYRAETAKKRREIHELSDPDQPRIFQVTRCSACGGQLDLPGVHFMCRHSYHQRCLGENESQCPNCARTHGVVREIRKNNAQLAGRHDLFLQEVHESDDPFASVANAFARGFMGSAGGAAAAQA